MNTKWTNCRFKLPIILPDFMYKSTSLHKHNIKNYHPPPPPPHNSTKIIQKQDWVERTYIHYATLKIFLGLFNSCQLVIHLSLLAVVSSVFHMFVIDIKCIDHKVKETKFVRKANLLPVSSALFYAWMLNVADMSSLPNSISVQNYNFFFLLLFDWWTNLLYMKKETCGPRLWHSISNDWDYRKEEVHREITCSRSVPAPCYEPSSWQGQEIKCEPCWGQWFPCFSALNSQYDVHVGLQTQS